MRKVERPQIRRDPPEADVGEAARLHQDEGIARLPHRTLC